MAQDVMAKILVFTRHDDIIHAARSIRAGARGYVVKSDDPDILLQATQQILAGKRFIGHGIAHKIAVEQSSGLNNLINLLSQRDFKVFSRLVAGHSISGIAKKLNISQKSAANIQTHIRQKLNVQNTNQMVHLATSYGIL